MRYEFSRKARQDISELIDYGLDQFGPAQTDQYLDGLYYSFDLLTDNPEMGKVAFGKTRRYRYRSHYVVYEIRQDVIWIANVRHVKQEFPPHWQ